MFTQKEFTLQQRGLLKFLKNYDISVQYHPGKANAVSNDLRRLSMGSLAHVQEQSKELVKDVHMLSLLGILLMNLLDTGKLIQNMVESSLIFEVKEKQDRNQILLELRDLFHNQRVDVFSQWANCILRYQGRLHVLDVGEFRQHTFAEDHNSRYYFHLGATKMYRDLRENYWWDDMKRDTENLVCECPSSQQVKLKHKKPGDMTQQIDIPT